MKKLSECRVLIVDDAKTNLDILVAGLQSEYRLSLALDGETALRLADKLQPDLVLLDIMMPGLDGYEVCRRLRGNPKTAETPVIFLSSLEDIASKTTGFEAGGNDYVTKPFDLREVHARANALLKAKAYNDAMKEQLAAELRIAREIQMGLLPSDFSALEKEFGVELASLLEPAREVGGDLFGVYPAGAGRLVFFIGDVSGKGIPAALFMARALSLARLLARDVADPARILARLNDELATDNPSNMFVTLLCAIFEPSTGRLSMSNGGHCRPVLLRRGNAPAWALPGLGTALGFEPGLPFHGAECLLQPGDAVVFYTDGVTEALNPGLECYGDARLLAAAARAADHAPAELVHEIFQDVRTFAAGAPQSDDIALLALRLPSSAATQPAGDSQPAAK